MTMMPGLAHPDNWLAKYRARTVGPIRYTRYP